MGIDDDDRFAVYRKVLFHRLDDHDRRFEVMHGKVESENRETREDIRELKEEFKEFRRLMHLQIAGIHDDVTSLKTKSAIWGAVGGSIVFSLIGFLWSILAKTVKP